MSAHHIVRAVGVVAMVGTALTACHDASGSSRTPAAADTSYRLRPGYVIDSIKPIEQELAAFRAPLGPAPTELDGGATSFDSLLSKFANAVAAGDTAALKGMQISAGEFAYLIYPSSPYTKPPYRETPQLVWYQLNATSRTGLMRLAGRRGGLPLRITDHHCDPNPLHEGDNILWRHCQVTTTGIAGKTPRTERLFGVVVERHGRFKFASYENQY